MREHEELVAALTKPGNDVLAGLSAGKAHLVPMAMGISGETGELLDCVKKHAIYGSPLDYDNLLEELGDLEFYAEGLRAALGITREDVLQANIDKLRLRYGSKYSDKAAQERADKP